MASTPPTTAHHGNATVLLQMLFCVSGIYVCFAYWSLLQEKLVKKPYRLKKNIPVAEAKDVDGIPYKEESMFSAVFTILLFQAIAGAAVGHVLCLKEGSARKDANEEKGKREEEEEDAERQNARVWTREDCQQVLWVGLTGVFGTSLGYAAMRRLSYPVVLSAKMSKMIPVMIVGTLIHRFRYPLVKVLACLCITAGVLSFYLLEDTEKLHKRDAAAHNPSEGRVGLLLLFFNLLSDGYMNSTQDALVRRKHLTGNQLMRLMNLVYVGLLTTLLVLLEVVPEAPLLRLVQAVLGPVSPAAAAAAQQLIRQQVAFKDLSRTLGFMRCYVDAGRDLLCMSVCNAVGQYFIFRTIYLFGSLTVTAMTLVRKVGSVVLSIVVHGYPVLPPQWGSLLLVLLGVVMEAKSNLKGKKQQASALPPPVLLQPPHGAAAAAGGGDGSTQSVSEWLAEMRRLSHRPHRHGSRTPSASPAPTHAAVSPALQQRIDLLLKGNEREKEGEEEKKQKAAARAAEGKKTIQWNTTPPSKPASRRSSTGSHSKVEEKDKETKAKKKRSPASSAASSRKGSPKASRSTAAKRAKKTETPARSSSAKKSAGSRTASAKSKKK